MGHDHVLVSGEVESGVLELGRDLIHRLLNDFPKRGKLLLSRYIDIRNQVLMTTKKKKTRPAREDLKAGEVLCDYCTAKCCRYFALPIDTPSTRRDYEFMRWYLLHDRASIFTENDTWYLLVHTTCKHLMDDHRCGIYDTRPPICREYTTDDCEYDDNWTYERYFESPEQIKEYADAILTDEHDVCLRSPKPAALPILN